MCSELTPCCSEIDEDRHGMICFRFVADNEADRFMRFPRELTPEERKSFKKFERKF